MGSSSSSSSSNITNTSNNCSSGGSNNANSSSSNIGSRPFSPGRAPQPPSNVYKGRGGLGGWLGLGWVGGSLKIPKPPSPL